MPLPLIPIAIGAVGVGVTGVAWLKLRKDKKRYEVRRGQYESCYESYRGTVEDVNAEIDSLNRQRGAAMKTLSRAADFLVRANVKDRHFDEGMRITAQEFEELQKKVAASMVELATSLGASAAGGGAAGVATAAGAYAAVSSFATASTGAAISGLSGIAARNATLAWLGGGTLASGGGGIAAGASTLLTISMAPLSIVPGIVMSAKAYRQGKRIDEEIEKMDVAEAEMSRHRAELWAVLEWKCEMSQAIREVEQALKDLLRISSTEVLEDVYRVAAVAKSLAELLDVEALRIFQNGADS